MGDERWEGVSGFGKDNKIGKGQRSGYSIKIMIWNVRGLAGVEKRKAVKDCCRRYRPDVVVL